jgi:hypothetical protein
MNSYEVERGEDGIACYYSRVVVRYFGGEFRIHTLERMAELYDGALHESGLRLRQPHQ